LVKRGYREAKKSNCLPRVKNEYKMDHSSDKGIYFLQFSEGKRRASQTYKVKSAFKLNVLTCLKMSALIRKYFGKLKARREVEGKGSAIGKNHPSLT